jgi:hypothetical protein
MSSDKIDDSLFKISLDDFHSQTFSCELLYFNSTPKEIIAIDKDHYSVRYVFNPEISMNVLDGLSQKLSNSEKNRILNRVQEVILDYQCQEGKKESLKLMSER